MRVKQSIITWLTAGTWKQILVIISGLTALQFLAYALASGGATYALHQLPRATRMPWLFALAFVLLTFVLSRFGTEQGSRHSYTLRRLRVSEREIVRIQALYNSLCYLLLWCAQILISYLLSKLYLAGSDSQTRSEQIHFLAYYRSAFLHSILPLNAWLLWARNLILCAALGICSAAVPYILRRGRTTIWIYLLTLATLLLFVRRLEEQSLQLFLLGISLACAALAILQVRRQEVLDDY